MSSGAVKTMPERGSGSESLKTAATAGPTEATLRQWPGTDCIHAQHRASAVKTGALACEAPADRLNAARGSLVGIALSAALWALAVASLAILRH